MSPDYSVVLTTTGNEEQAINLARLIVEARLGACVQIQGIKSILLLEG